MIMDFVGGSTILPLRAALDREIRRTQLGNSIRSAKNVMKIIAPGLLVAISYYLGVQLGSALTPPHGPISAFWPPNAILLAAFLVTPRKRWWILILGVLPAHLLAQLPQGVPLATSVGWFLGNTGEGLLGGYLITELQDVPELFSSVRGLLVFLAFAVLGAPLVTSFLDIGAVILTGWGEHFWHLWATRQLSNMLGELTIVPPIVLFRFRAAEWFSRARWTRYFEGIVLAIFIAGTCVYEITGAVSRDQQIYLLYVVLILLSWATLRFGCAGLSTSLLTLSIVSSWAVIHGHSLYLATEANVIPLQLFLFAVALPSLFTAVVLVQQGETATSLRDSKTQFVNSQEQERSRIARELHDGVGQLLSLVELEITQLSEGFDFELKLKLQELGSQVAEVSQVTREISHGLHPAHLDLLGLSAALRRLCADVGRENAVPVEFQEVNIPEHLDPNVSLSLYRIAQEALHNAAKYSKANRIRIRLRATSGRLSLEVNDDGIGFTKSETASRGIGLLNMRERMESIGGKLSVRSTQGRGTTVHASVSIRNPA
jgi:two-component system, NarL family, sensor histidine kinase FusK